MAYSYKGTIHDLDTPAPKPVTQGKHYGFDPSACDTYAGYRRHQKWGVPACQPCKDAMAAYSRDRYQPKQPKAFDPSACGTWAGWSRHRYHDVPLCDPCKTAANDYQRQYRTTRREAKRARPVTVGIFDPSACGTYGGYKRHYRHGTDACPACLTAYADYMKDYRTRRAA